MVDSRDSACLPVVLPDSVAAGTSLRMELHCVLIHHAQHCVRVEGARILLRGVVKFDQVCALLV